MNSLLPDFPLRPKCCYHHSRQVFKEVKWRREGQECSIKRSLGTSLVSQWLGRHTPYAGDLGWIPGSGNKIPRLQLRPGITKIKEKIFGASLVAQWQRICWPANAEDMGLIPDPGRPCATEQLSPWTTTTESCGP